MLKAMTALPSFVTRYISQAEYARLVREREHLYSDSCGCGQCEKIFRKAVVDALVRGDAERKPPSESVYQQLKRLGKLPKNGVRCTMCQGTGHTGMGRCLNCEGVGGVKKKVRKRVLD